MAARLFAKKNENNIGFALYGLEETLKALKQYEPDAKKELLKAIREATGIIRMDAKRSVRKLTVPSGWKSQSGMPNGSGSWKNRELTRGGKGWPPWEPANVSRNIKSTVSKRGGGRRNIISQRGVIRSQSGEGVIYEFAKKSHKSPKYPWVNSRPFIKKLGKMKGGRLLWAAGERRKTEVQEKIMLALFVANGKLQRALDSVKEGDR